MALAIIAAKVIVGAHYLNAVDNPVTPLLLQFLEPNDVLPTCFSYSFLNLLTIKLGGLIDGQRIAIAPDDRLSAFGTFAVPLCEWFVARWAFHRNRMECFAGMRVRANEMVKKTAERESNLIEHISNMVERDVGHNGGSERKNSLVGISTKVSRDNSKRKRSFGSKVQRSLEKRASPCSPWRRLYNHRNANH